MENINILINKKTRQVNLTKSVIGNDGENLQENFIFSFDEFVNGTARLELIKNNGVKSYIMLTKVDNTYQLPIKSVITKGGRITMQLVITEGTDDEEIPIFKSNEFYVVVNSSINAEIEEPDEYAEWIDVANTKLNELDNIDIDVEKVGTTATITITKKDGTEESVNIYDGAKGDKGDKGDKGEQGIQGIQGIQGVPGKDGKDGTNGTNGVDGKDAKINGVNTLTIEAGSNITLNQSGSTLTISSTGGSGGTSNYSDLSNKPKINNVELSGNKSTSDLGIVIPSNSDFTLNGLSEKSYNNLTDKPTIPTVPTNVSAFTNDAGYLTQHQDISGKLDTSKVKSTYSTTSGDIYDVSYINSTIGDISSALDSINGEVI